MTGGGVAFTTITENCATLVTVVFEALRASYLSAKRTVIPNNRSNRRNMQGVDVRFLLDCTYVSIIVIRLTFFAQSLTNVKGPLPLGARVALKCISKIAEKN